MGSGLRASVDRMGGGFLRTIRYEMKKNRTLLFQAAVSLSVAATQRGLAAQAQNV